jgi:hypothetical protein
MGEPTKERVRQGAPPAPVKPAEKTIIVVPDQHHDDIERRRQIREAFHDLQSRTIKADRDES